MEIIEIYVYNEHCTQAGRIADEPQGDDTRTYRGTPQELELIARQLCERQDNRPGGAGDAYRNKVGRNMLEYLEDYGYIDTEEEPEGNDE